MSSMKSGSTSCVVSPHMSSLDRSLVAFLITQSIMTRKINREVMHPCLSGSTYNMFQMGDEPEAAATTRTAAVHQDDGTREKVR